MASNVERCTGKVRAGKGIERRIEEEDTLLDDLLLWVLRSGSGPQDPLFSRRVQFPEKPLMLKKRTAKMVADMIKAYV